MSYVANFLLWLLALVGVAALALALMLASPVRRRRRSLLSMRAR